jgi:hypothetical protein
MPAPPGMPARISSTSLIAVIPRWVIRPVCAVDVIKHVQMIGASSVN